MHAPGARLRILIYGLNYAPEPVGIGKYTGELGAWLAKRGHEVHVVCSVPYFPEWRVRGNWYKQEQLNGVEVWRCPIWVPKRPNGVTRIVHLGSFAVSSLPPLMLQWFWRPDVVMCIAPALLCAPGALCLAHLCGKKTMSWLHIQDFELDVAFDLGLLKGNWIRRMVESWERNTIKGFSRASTICEAMRRKLVTKGAEEKNSVLVKNWVDMERIFPVTSTNNTMNCFRKRLGIRKDQTVLLYAGSMNKKQGLELIAEVIRTLKDEEDILWVLAGDGPEKLMLMKKVEHMNNVRVIPLVPDEELNELLNMADIHLLPQKAGAADLVLPSKLTGMLASGRPVLTTAPLHSELGSLVIQAGYRVDPGDIKGFAEAVLKLTRNKGLRKMKGEQARRIAAEQYEKEKVLRSLEEEIKDAVDQRREGVGPGK